MGSYSALNLAKLGVKRTVFEEHPEIGFPISLRGAPEYSKLKEHGFISASRGNC